MNNDKVVAFMIAENVSTPANIRVLKDANQSVKIKADLQDTTEWNRNGRKYPTETVKKGLLRENIQELIAKKSWFGEAGHPVDPTAARHMTVVQNNVSHRILNYSFRGPIVEGIVKTTPTKQGLFMRDMILDDDPMESAFSLRAMGPIRETPQGKVVQDPLSVVTYDWVFYPSHRKAYQRDIIGVTPEGNSLTECGLIYPLLESSAIEYIAEESKHFKLVSELLEFDKKNAMLSEDARKVIISDSNGNSKDTLVVGVESFISHEITNYFNKFR